MTVSEGDDALRLRETKGVGVVAVFAEVVASTAVVTVCYVTAGTFARRGLSSTAKTLRSLVRWFEVLSTKSKKRT